MFTTYEYIRHIYNPCIFKLYLYVSSITYTYTIYYTYLYLYTSIIRVQGCLCIRSHALLVCIYMQALCLLGSSVFSKIQAKAQSAVELPATVMLFTAALAMTAATVFGSTSLPVLIAAFFLFEACVGMYFPSIGTLRSKYIPDSHRSVIMNLFGVPLNLIVVSVFLSIKSLGVSGALACASAALGVAAVCMTTLLVTINRAKPAATTVQLRCYMKSTYCIKGSACLMIPLHLRYDVYLQVCMYVAS